MSDNKSILLSKFPEFKRSQEFSEKLLEYGNLMEVPKGTVLINSGEYIKVIPLLLDGLIKIYREDDDGNEILLYYINSGESCVISITTSLKDEKSSIKALVEEDSTLLAVSKDKFLLLLNQYNLLHTFTYDLFNSKYNELINSIDSLAFSDTKSRLLNYLNTKAKHNGTKILVGLTHKEIAKDLSTSREVVSRLLYALQKANKLTIDNKIITLLDKL